MPTRVKICGLTRLEDAQRAADLGAAALGFNFYPLSPRYIEPAAARAIVRRLPPFVTAVGVFADETDARHVISLAREAGVTTVQVHGPRFPALPELLSVFTLVVAVAVRQGFKPEELGKIEASAFLLDAFDPDRLGGTGKTSDWNAAREAKQYGPIILAGGLTPENVARAVREVRPFAVDVASGVESAPGIKDPAKLEAFFAAVAEADQESLEGGRSASGDATSDELRRGHENMTKSFTTDDLEGIVNLGGQALEAEDRSICGCFHRNPAYQGRKRPAGITYLKDERHYQRVVVRALLPSFRYAVETEYPRGGHSFDFALFSATSAEPAALGELKLCMDKELGPIREIAGDIERLAGESCGQFVLLCTVTEKSGLDAYIDDLLRALGRSGDKPYVYRFDTEFDSDGHGSIEQNGQFAVIGLLLKEGAA